MKKVILLLAIILPVLANSSKKPFIPYESKQNLESISAVEPYADGSLRLPIELSPIRYFVRLQGFINGDMTTDGFVEIDFMVNTATTNITFHADRMTIDFNSVVLAPVDDPSSDLSFTDQIIDEEREFYVGTVVEPLTAGRMYRIQMDFTGSVGTNLGGFYLSTYVNENGETINIGTTQFQSTYARWAFPCFDEPAMKATFEIQMAREADIYHVLSNAPIVSTFNVENQPGWVWDVFEITPKMSSYLVAFCITDYISVEAVGNNEVTTRIWAPRHNIINGEADYALEIAMKLLDALAVNYEFPYPMDKCDHISINDFAAGAMENWGLVTYRDEYLLWDQQYGTSPHLEVVANIIAHELAHMWFGNLVTLDWWSQAWLNEGFATYVSYHGLDLADPTLEMGEQFLIDEMQPVMDLDDSDDVRPLNRDPETRGQITAMFNSLTYSKGGSIVRMMYYIFGEETTRKALVNYLRELSYATSTEDLLFGYIDDEAKIDGTLDPSHNVSEIMKTWTNQPGFPIIEVTFNGDGTATVTQERYIYPEDVSAAPVTYWVPISYTSGNAPDFSTAVPSVYMSPDDTTITITGLATDTWHIFNLLHGGYYRVNYSYENWMLISDQLISDINVIDVRNRLQIVYESWLFAVRGNLGYDVPLTISQYLNNEEKYITWVPVLEQLEYIDAMFTRQNNYDNLQNYLSTMVTPQFDRLGFNENPDDTHTVLLLRALLSTWACNLDYASCLSSASDLYSQWMSSPDDYTIISPDSKGNTYCSAVSNGGDAEWDFAYDRYVDDFRPSEISHLVYAMGCSKNASTLETYLDMVFDTSTEIGQNGDASDAFNSVCKNDDGGNDVAWTYLETNYQAIAAFYGDYVNVQRFAQYCAEEYNTQEELDKVQNFYDLIQPELGTEEIMTNLIETINDNIQWMTDNYQFITNWLLANGYGQRM